MYRVLVGDQECRRMRQSRVGTDVSRPCRQPRMSESVEICSTSSNMINWGKGRDTSVPTGDVSALIILYTHHTPHGPLASRSNQHAYTQPHATSVTDR